MFALFSAGDCVGAVLWHGVCGPAVVGRLPQQICRHQRTPPLYQETHINHRCTWLFPLFSFNTTHAIKYICRWTSQIIPARLHFCIKLKIIVALIWLWVFFFSFFFMCLSHRFNSGHRLNHCAWCGVKRPSVRNICHQVEQWFSSAF